MERHSPLIWPKLSGAVVPHGLRVLVCRPSVLQRQNDNSFVIRKMNRSGFPVVWGPDNYLAALEPPLTAGFRDSAADSENTINGAVLATDLNFSELTDSNSLAEEFPWLLPSPRPVDLSISDTPTPLIAANV